LGTYATPNLDKIWKTEGVLVPRLQPEFPASRIPFLASLLTGRHSEKHEVLISFFKLNILKVDGQL
jgi:predicted AlkP superfamily pyrophosphatase or phosphodiesterase